MALLAPSSSTLWLQDHWLHKITGCWRGYRPSEVSWMGHASWMCTHSPHIHHAPEERSGEGAHPFCHWKYNVQRDLEEGIYYWGDCPRSTGFHASHNKWSSIPWNSITYHGSPPWWDCWIKFLNCVDYMGIFVNMYMRHCTYAWRGPSIVCIFHWSRLPSFHHWFHILSWQLVGCFLIGPKNGRDSLWWIWHILKYFSFSTGIEDEKFLSYVLSPVFLCKYMIDDVCQLVNYAVFIFSVGSYGAGASLSCLLCILFLWTCRLFFNRFFWKIVFPRIISW